MDLRIIERLEKSFPRFSSLWIGIIVIILLLIPVDQLFGDLISSGLTKGIVYGLILFSYFIIWIYYRQKLPRKIGDKIGFVISIETENDEQKLRIKNDFSSHIKELLSENNITDAFDLLLLNDFQTERVNKILYNYSELLKRTKKNNYLLTSLDRKIHRNWESAIRKTGGNFWVWGQIKERNELNSKYFFNLEAIVTHDPISIRENNPVQKAFDDAWIKKISVDERIELIGFEFTAELVYVGVNYVTGIAAFISRDPFTALKLHENLLLELHKRFNPLPPKYKILDKNLHEFLSDECAAISHFYMLQENIPTAQEYLDKLFQYSEDNYEGHLLKAVFEFNSKYDALKALETIKKAAKLSKNTVHGDIAKHSYYYT